MFQIEEIASLRPEEKDAILDALLGMALADVCTPALIIELDAFEANIATLRDKLQAAGVRHR